MDNQGTPLRSNRESRKRKCDRLLTNEGKREVKMPASWAEGEETRVSSVGYNRGELTRRMGRKDSGRGFKNRRGRKEITRYLRIFDTLLAGILREKGPGEKRRSECCSAQRRKSSTT